MNIKIDKKFMSEFSITLVFYLNLTEDYKCNENRDGKETKNERGKVKSPSERVRQKKVSRR